LSAHDDLRADGKFFKHVGFDFIPTGQRWRLRRQVRHDQLVDRTLSHRLSR